MSINMPEKVNQSLLIPVDCHDPKDIVLAPQRPAYGAQISQYTPHIVKHRLGRAVPHRIYWK